MNFDFCGAIKVACACIVATSVAVVAATTAITETFFNCGASSSSPLRRRRNKSSWSSMKNTLFGNKDEDVCVVGDSRDIEEDTASRGVAISVVNSDERNSSHQIIDNSQLIVDQSENRNVLTKFISPDMLVEMLPKQTPTGFTLKQALVEDVDGKHADLIAGDASTYEVFSEVFDPFVSAENQGFEARNSRYPFAFDPAQLSESHVVDREFISSIHFMVSRSIMEYKFLPFNTVAEKLEIEEVMSKVFDSLPCELRGSYCSLSTNSAMESCEGASMAANPQERLEDVLFEVLPIGLHQQPDSDYYERTGINRDWPQGRGIFTDQSGSTSISVNRDDHLRIYHTEQSGDLVTVFGSLCKIYRAVQRGLSRNNLHFAYDKKYGFISWSPSLIGASMSIAVKIRLPLLQKHEKFQALLSECNLRCDYVNQNAEGEDVVQLSLKKIMGLSEVEMVDVLWYGLHRLIKLEKMLQKGTCTPLDMPSDYSCNKYKEGNEFGAARRCARLSSINAKKSQCRQVI